VRGHLTPEQFVDLFEGGQSEAAASHLRACDRCTRQLADLRAAVESVERATVPEPSPLFWEHFAARVHDALQAEPAPRPWRARWRTWPGATPVWASAVLVAMLAVAVVIRLERRPHLATGPGTTAEGGSGSFDLLGSADDASLSLVADLVADLSWDDAREAGLTGHVGTDDDAVAQLDDGERYELDRLLKGELEKAGGS